jgi:flagellar biogenesis protein FliO
MSPLAAYIVESFVTLVGVVVLAVVVLYGARRLGLGRPEGPLELLGRLPLDARRAVYLVKVGKLVYVVGASEAGLVRLGEVSAVELGAPTGRRAVNGAFAKALARVTKSGFRPAQATSEAEAAATAAVSGGVADRADARAAQEHG